jgi:hypothetical protein
MELRAEFVEIVEILGMPKSFWKDAFSVVFLDC